MDNLQRYESALISDWRPATREEVIELKEDLQTGAGIELLHLAKTLRGKVRYISEVSGTLFVDREDGTDVIEVQLSLPPVLQ